MAWERFAVGEFSGMCGDQPMDQVTLCLARVAAMYERRYARRPYYVELLYCLEVVLATGRVRYTSEEAHPENFALLRGLSIPDLTTVDPEEYEAISEEETPDEYVVVKISADTDVEVPYSKVVRVVELSIVSGHLRCVYLLLNSTLSPTTVKPLIRRTIVERLLGVDWTSLTSEDYILKE